MDNKLQLAIARFINISAIGLFLFIFDRFMVFLFGEF